MSFIKEEKKTKETKKEYIIVTLSNDDDDNGIRVILLHNDVSDRYALNLLEVLKTCNNTTNSEEWKEFVFKKYYNLWKEDEGFDLRYDVTKQSYSPYELVDFLFQCKYKNPNIGTDNGTYLLLFYEKTGEEIEFIKNIRIFLSPITGNKN